MAPEQAEGRSKDSGPAADVYALGAILYECLTGRPPFQGASPLETLELVRAQEPVPPRLLQPKVPRDLETICLKCLRKDPDGRYASAGELADDLGRFRAGEPIRARSYNLLQRLARTLDRRHLKIELRTWGNVFLLFVPMALLTHLAVFALLRAEAAHAELWTLGIVATELTAMSALFAYFRSRLRLPLSTTEAELVSMATAYMVACGLMAVAVYPTARSTRELASSLYPLWTIVTGLLFCIVGDRYWGQSYFMGLGFFVLGMVMLVTPNWAPLAFGLASAVYFTATGLYLRRLGDEIARRPAEARPPGGPPTPSPATEVR
jgi:hypothetical protein